MIRINKNHINRFKRNNCEYLYYVNRGVFLAFDLNTYEYIGIELYYLPANYDKVSFMCEEKIKYLLAKEILEIYEER